MNFHPKDPHFEQRIRDSFSRQTVMDTIGATLTHVAPGEVDITLPYRADLTQQNGFLHAGIVTTIVDSACGYAAYTLMPADFDVLSVEFKVNLLNPAKGSRFVAQACVIKPGRTLTVVRGDVFAFEGDQKTLIATMLATMIGLAKA